jgi:hypothetical protein
MGQGYAVAGIEPPLEELLDDLIMRRDGIEPADVWRSIAAARARLGPRASDPDTLPHGVDTIVELSPSLITDGQISRSVD